MLLVLAELLHELVVGEAVGHLAAPLAGEDELPEDFLEVVVLLREGIGHIAHERRGPGQRRPRQRHGGRGGNGPGDGHGSGRGGRGVGVRERHRHLPGRRAERGLEQLARNGRHARRLRTVDRRCGGGHRIRRLLERVRRRGDLLEGEGARARRRREERLVIQGGRRCPFGLEGHGRGLEVMRLGRRGRRKGERLLGGRCGEGLQRLGRASKRQFRRSPGQDSPLGQGHMRRVLGARRGRGEVHRRHGLGRHRRRHGRGHGGHGAANAERVPPFGGGLHGLALAGAHHHRPHQAQPQQAREAHEGIALIVRQRAQEGPGADQGDHLVGGALQLPARPHQQGRLTSQVVLARGEHRQLHGPQRLELPPLHDGLRGLERGDRTVDKRLLPSAGHHLVLLHQAERGGARGDRGAIEEPFGQQRHPHHQRRGELRLQALRPGDAHEVPEHGHGGKSVRHAEGLHHGRGLRRDQRLHVQRGALRRPLLPHTRMPRARGRRERDDHAGDVLGQHGLGGGLDRSKARASRTLGVHHLLHRGDQLGTRRQPQGQGPGNRTPAFQGAHHLGGARTRLRLSPCDGLGPQGPRQHSEVGQAQREHQECENEKLDANHRRPLAQRGGLLAYSVHRSSPARIGVATREALGRQAGSLEARALAPLLSALVRRNLGLEIAGQALGCHAAPPLDAALQGLLQTVPRRVNGLVQRLRGLGDVNGLEPWHAHRHPALLVHASLGAVDVHERDVDLRRLVISEPLDVSHQMLIHVCLQPIRQGQVDPSHQHLHGITSGPEDRQPASGGGWQRPCSPALPAARA
ncbi:hypothetical protein STIAU_1074 [Stigmatella aurantiaca DW4/3-1]|uniref:Uncharacterized protein n=1 Tax=Stigmatella aurantiaca (strain DW4/3-1) TaxID=378806 RepID=Q091F3_STIAD|nr:hypothetical protein STIAU_1074 [Stigmatella aurantiaca DW4/3-1]